MNQKLLTVIVFSFLIQTQLFSQNNISLAKLWELDQGISTPESVIFDNTRNCLYISNFNDKTGFRNRQDTLLDEYLSKVDLEGKLIEQKWVNGLLGPTGMMIHNDTLYVVERGYLSKIDIDKQTIVERLPISGTKFLNDIVIDKNGDIYISDTKKEGTIFKISKGKCEAWYSDSLIQNCNGLFLDDDQLIMGTRGRTSLVSISINDKTTKVLTSKIADGIDGLKKYGKDFIVSWRYEILAVNQNGDSFLLEDSSDKKDWNADIELIESKDMIIVPTLLTNKLIAYKVDVR